MKRRNGSEAIHLRRRIVAHADRANFPLFIKFPQCRGCFLNRRHSVRPMHLVNIDVVGLQAPQRVLKLLQNSFAAGVALNRTRGPIEAHLGCEDNIVPAPVLVNGFANDLFRTPLSINRRRVDQVDALVERRMNRANGLLFVRSAPHPAANSPGTQSDPGAFESCTFNVDVFDHFVFSFSSC